MKPTNSRLIPNSIRIAQRDTPGSITSIYHAALSELANGKAGNAWAMFHEVLGRALQAKWREVSGKPNSPIDDTTILVKKLRGFGYLDGWSYGLLAHVVKSERAKPTLQRCDLLASIVAVIVFDLPVKGGVV
jgi:hypothetical protein